MRLPAGLIALTLCSAACVTLVGEQQHARAEIAAVIQSGIEASRRGDVEGFLARLPHDLIIEQSNGRVATYEQVRQAHLNRARSPSDTISLTIDIERAEIRGDEATIWTNQLWERKVSQGGETYRVLTTQRHEERWRRRGSRWQPYRIKELGGQAFVNGVLQPPQPRAAD